MRHLSWAVGLLLVVCAFRAPRPGAGTIEVITDPGVVAAAREAWAEQRAHRLDELLAKPAGYRAMTPRRWI